MLKLGLDEALLDDYVDGCGGLDIIQTLLTHFKEQVPLKVESCRAAIADSNQKSLCSTLHSLKNSFINVGAVELGNRMQELEQQAMTRPVSEITPALSEILNVIGPVTTAVEDYVQRKSVLGKSL